jgi:glycerol-3-phosphate dehydrogenase
VEYFIKMVGRVFPGIKVSREQIVFRFSGVRPLAYTKAKNAGQITRDHHIQEDRLGNIPIFSLVGGKWTSFRAFSEQVTDRALEFLNLTRKTDTRSLPIGAGKDAMPIKTDQNYTREEIKAIVKREKIVHLDDLLMRRTLLAYLGQLSRSLVEELGDWLGDELGWSGQQKKQEEERVIRILADKHGVRL